MVTTHCFNVEDAIKYGVECAVILYNIRFWCDKNQANGTHEHDGYYWTYNSTRAFSTLFPYLTQEQIKGRLKKLEDMGAIISGEYNQMKYDRTKWYTSPLHCVVSPNGLGDSTQSIVSDDPTYTRYNTDINTNITTDTISEQSSQEIPEIIKEFESLNPACKNFYGNKTQRKAVQDLIDVHGYDRVVFLIREVLPKSNKVAYMPNITTPVQLRDGYAKLENALHKHKAGQSNKYQATVI